MKKPIPKNKKINYWTNTNNIIISKLHLSALELKFTEEFSCIQKEGVIEEDHYYVLYWHLKLNIVHYC